MKHFAFNKITAYTRIIFVIEEKSNIFAYDILKFY